MQGNSIVEIENGVLKLTSSSDQLTCLTNSHIHQQNDKNNSLKKVKSMNSNETASINHRGKIDHKAFNVRLNTYKNKQNDFIIASNNLKNCYEKLKKFQMDSSSDKNQSSLDELKIMVKEIIENVFGIKFPQSKTLLKVDHRIFVPDLNKPMEMDINSTSGHLEFDLAIKEAYEVVRKIFLEISETNIKYHFWLKMIIEPKEFLDLCDVREYLIQYMSNKEQTVEQLELKLKNLKNDLQLKLINIVNVVGEILKNEKYTEKKQNDALKDHDLGNLETNAEIIIEDYKQKMNKKVKMLEMENKNLKEKETEFSKQIETLLEELAFRNGRLIDIKDHLSLLMKEKNDLICMIKKMEVKEEGLQTLQNKLSIEKKKNEHLRAIVAKEYEPTN